MRILVTGSRDWNDELVIVRALNEAKCGISYRDVILVHGACKTGADYLADLWAAERGIEIERHPAKWREFGKSAGFMRNFEMVDLGADICLAFIKNNSRGASHCAYYAEVRGIPVRRYVIEDDA